MSWRTMVAVGTVAACACLLAGGCSEENALITGPTPAGVTTGGTVSIPSVSPVQSAPGGASTPTSTETTEGHSASGAGTVTAVELAVRQTAGGCWEVLAPGAAAQVTRQDLWYPSTADCGGPGWSIALRVFTSAGALHASAAAGGTSGSGSGSGSASGSAYADANVLVLVAAGASATARAAVASVPGLVALADHS